MQRGGAADVRRRDSGYTLIEVGLVILLLGAVAVMVADFYVNQLNLSKEGRRVAGTVRDMQILIDASVLWSESFGRWPNDGNVIAVEPLVSAGFLTEVTRPRNRYAECANCEDYTILGWDRDVVGPDGKGDFTSMASEAEDLVVRVEVLGRTDAELIAGQLPLGHAVETTMGSFAIEARVFEGGIRTGNFVRVQNENRPVVFAVDSRSHNVQGGDLQRVGRITAKKQRVPCGPDQSPLLDDCHSATSRLVTDGPAILFHERPCQTGEDPTEAGCRYECPPGLPKQEGDSCQAAPATDQPTVLFREDVARRMCANDFGNAGGDPDCDPFFDVGPGPAVVLHGADAATRAPGPTVHLLADTASGYAKVRVVGGLEIERIAGQDDSSHPRPGQPPGSASGTWEYSLPSSRDVVTQAELDWVQCCLRELDVTFGTQDPNNPTPESVSCDINDVRACVRQRHAARLAATP